MLVDHAETIISTGRRTAQTIACWQMFHYFVYPSHYLRALLPYNSISQLAGQTTKSSMMSREYSMANDEGFRQSHLRPRKLSCYSPVSQDVYHVPDTISAASERHATAIDGLLSLREPSSSFYPPKSPSPHSPGSSSAPMTDTESVKSDTQDAAMLDWTSSGTKYEREFHQEKQIRYRQKQNQHMKELEVVNQQVGERTNQFDDRRHNIITTLPAKEHLWSLVSEYFRLFRCGLQSRAQVPTQVNFLRTMMAPDVAFNAGRSSEAMIRSWKCISLWFQDIDLELEELVRGAGDAVVATTTTRITINERTLRNVFPHLCHNNRAYNMLAAKLLGQRLVMRGSTRFEWDSERHHVVSVMSQSDMLSPMLNLLGNRVDIQRVFEKSIISPAFQWRSTSA